MKVRIFFTLVAAISSLSAICTMAFGWQKDTNGWWYELSDGSYPQNEWAYINDGTGQYYYYYFNQDGYMCADMITPDGYYVGVDGRWIESTSASTNYTEENLKNIIMSQAIGTLRNSIVADFNGDGKIEMAAVVVDTGGNERGCTAYRWYTDGINTYCYETSNYWWLKEDNFYIIEADDGYHLGETIVDRTAADICRSTVVSFNSDGAEKFYDEYNIYFTGTSGRNINYERREIDNAEAGLMSLKTTGSGTLALINGRYQQIGEEDSRTIYERYGKKITVYCENPRDMDDYYEYDAQIYPAMDYVPPEITPHYTTVKVRKDALVRFYTDKMELKTLDEYGIQYLRLFSSIVQDENGCVISFVDVHAG